MYHLKLIIASTRPERKGILVANWFLTILKEHHEFQTEVLDLKEINLPFLDEPFHPREKKYTKEHTKKWSKTIDEGDAFIVVTPEYNFGFPATIKNALDFLYQEWNEKPIAFVSYGGISGGTRSVQMLKQVVTTLKMMPIVEAVNIPFFSKHIEDGKFTGNEIMENTAHKMLDELLKWTKILKQKRE